MSGLHFGLGLTMQRRGGKAWKPAALFANGEAGAWYEAKPPYLFQDVRASIPAITHGDEVRLILDRRYIEGPLPTGPELVTNGGFTDATGWTLFQSAGVSGGALNANGSNTGDLATRLVTGLVVGQTYMVAVDMTAYTTGSAHILIRNAANSSTIASKLSVASVGTHVFLFKAIETSCLIRVQSGNSGSQLSLDNISIKIGVPGEHMSILATGTPGILKDVGNGQFYVDCSADGCAFKTNNNKIIQLPLYVALAASVRTEKDVALFGIILAATGLFGLRGHTTLNHIKSYLRNSAAGVSSPVVNDQVAPVRAPLVADALAIIGTTDVIVNGVSGNYASNAFDAGTSAAGAVYGINMGTATGTSNGNQFFYGGIILHADPGASKRAQTVKYLRALVERPALSSDFNILVLGDSTGDKAPGGAGDPNGEWVWRFGAEKLAADDPTAFVGYRCYDERNYGYNPEIVIQEGTGGPAYRIYNCSQSGRTPQWHTGIHFRTGIVDIPKPSAIWWNHGHNIVAIGSSVASYKGRLIGPMDQVRLQWPGVPHLAILQNPWRDGTQMTSLIEALEYVCALYGDIATVNVHQHYLDNSKPPDWYLDNAHPSLPAGVSEWMPLIEAVWDAQWPRVPAAAAFVASKADNMLANGKFEQFANGVPVDWALVGDGSVSQDAAIRDGDDLYSIRIVNGETEATFLTQALSAVPYRGQMVTLAVRQYIVDPENISPLPYAPAVAPNSANNTAGQISVGSDGTGGGATVNWAGATLLGSNGWRWMVAQYTVPVDATTITVDLYASSIAGDDEGTVCFGRAVLVSGQEPRDMH